jgi:uncharacterized damage-inducible protein DinB
MTGRPEPPYAGDEVSTLRGFLGYHRAMLREKCADLDAAQLAHRLLPSTMTLGGMLKHLALVESQWFSEYFLDEPLLSPFDTADWEADWDWDWHSAGDDSPEELLALYDSAIRASDRILEDALRRSEGLDALAQRPTRRGHRVSLRWILVHLVEEYAQHNGHADLIRESVDGRTGY